MTRRMKAAALAVVILLPVLVIVGRIVTARDPFVPLVQEIYRTPQTYGGEVVDKLVALGPDAVPAIGSVLLTGPEFPIVFVRALERIGDQRGTEPIVEFISKRAPYSNVDGSTLTTRSIQALRGIQNTAACKPIVSILRSETAHPRVRLASASTCARLCSGDVKAEAQSFILSAYDDRARYLAKPNEGFAQSELYSALIDVDNDESLAILLNVLEGGAPPYIAQPIIGYLARKEGENVADSLERVLGDSYNYELTVRLAAARAILDTGKPPSQSLRSRIDELANEASPDVYGQAIVDEAQQLRARAAER
jgi:hypothetical protein